ncbi:tRNA (adenosine(37)-N6)-dimethylallyltransferase MiaA [Patescibacteria group bacterium]|nr:tRNA (adenosine(37)-N6)-dimethylallyltransferase MiaA [Patescibacteria group bacterium]
MSRKKLIVILGPTASGKTALAIKLAKKFNGEIVSADSRQVYQGMNIGTGKTTKKEMASIPHYLIDVVKPNQEFNVAVYKKLAIEKIKDVQKKEKLPFLVGGTGLYIGAVVDNIEFPKVTPQRKLRKELEKKSAKELFEIYKKLDPEGAKFIEKENKRRLVRAIEVCEVTGKPFFEQRKKGKPIFEVLQIGVKLPREELKKRISKRIDKMIELGLEKEVKKLVKKYGWISSLQTIGYQEWLPYFEGKINKKEATAEKIKTHTLQFAKRQETWFKKDKRIKWVPPTHHPFRYAEKLIKEFIKKCRI